MFYLCNILMLVNFMNTNMADKNIQKILPELDDRLKKVIDGLTADQREIYESTPIDITKFAASFGFKLLEFKQNSLEGFILIQQDEKLIGVNSQLSYEEKRFTIAHELSHFLLDENLFDNGRCKIATKFAHVDEIRAYAARPAEQIIDYFAACILIPKEKLNESDLKEPNKLAKKFGVTPKCMIRRIEEVQDGA